MKYLWSASALLLVLVPSLVSAADGIPDISGDFVPCGDPGLPSCQTCHIYVLIDNVFAWVFGMAFVVTAIIIVIGGLRMATAGGNQVGKRDALRWIRTAAFGFVLIMSAWVLVDLLIATLYGEPDAAGIWSSFECVDQPDPGGSGGIRSIEADAVPDADGEGDSEWYEDVDPDSVVRRTVYRNVVTGEMGFRDWSGETGTWVECSNDWSEFYSAHLTSTVPPQPLEVLESCVEQ